MKTYEEAYEYARTQATLYQRPMGLERHGKEFTVCMLPKDPAKRFGWETRCQVVEPNEPRTVRRG